MARRTVQVSERSQGRLTWLSTVSGLTREEVLDRAVALYSTLEEYLEDSDRVDTVLTGVQGPMTVSAKMLHPIEEAD